MNDRLVIGMIDVDHEHHLLFSHLSLPAPSRSAHAGGPCGVDGFVMSRIYSFQKPKSVDATHLARALVIPIISHGSTILLKNLSARTGARVLSRL
jgi:hypothetical protein